MQMVQSIMQGTAGGVSFTHWVKPKTSYVMPHEGVVTDAKMFIAVDMNELCSVMTMYMWS